jgi:hypothetical protein
MRVRICTYCLVRPDLTSPDLTPPDLTLMVWVLSGLVLSGLTSRTCIAVLALCTDT